MNTTPEIIKDLIRKGTTENAIYELQYLSNNIRNKTNRERLKNSADILSHNYNLNKWKYNMGFLTTDEWTGYQNRIANSILELLTEINGIEVLQIENEPKLITFSKIDIKTKICCWFNRNSEVENSIYDFHEEMRGESKAIKNIDPIFDITILNETPDPIIITQIGFVPISARKDIKGIPISGKIEILEGYTIRVNKFNFGEEEVLNLEDPIYLEGKAAFRFTLKLENYRSVAISKGNDTVMKILIRANKQRIQSQLIKMGMF